MADCSHPPHRNRGLAKNLSSVFGFGSKGVYDDVFVARPQMRVPSFTPVVRDYAEVFNCSQASSIPVLELDEFDLGRSSKVDYGNVFTGLGESQIGSDYAEVFCIADGVRRTDDSHAHSRGLDRSTTLENSQKLTHESLHGKKRTISYDKITLGGKDETDETTGQAKKFEVQVCIRAIDGIIPLKRAEASRSGATTNNFKQYSDEVLVGKHSRNVSSGGLSKHDADGFIEIDVRSRNGYDSDKSTSSGMPMEANLIRSKEQIFEVITPSVSIMHLGSPNATFKEQAGLKSNASEDQCGGCNSPSREDVEVQNMDNPFVRDCAVDERAAMHISVGSKVISSSGLSQDLNDACVTSEILMGNSNACSNNASEKAKDDTYYSQQDVTFQTINSSERSFISNSLVETSVLRPQEISKSTPATHSQHNFGNIALEVDIVPKIVASRNADSECADTGYGHLTNNVESQNQVALDERTSSDVPVDTKVINLNSQNSKVIPPSVVRCSLENVTPAVRKATISKSSELRKSTYSSAKDNHSPSSSDDEIDKNSEAAISAAAVKKAIREAQAWINIAKESKGVKGFMKPVVAKTFRQVKVLKDVHFSKETVKSFELGQTTIENNCSTSASTKYFIAPLSTSSEIKMAPTNTVGEERDFKGTEFCISDELHQVEGVLMQTFSKKLEFAPAIQNATPSINTLEERLTVYSTAAEEKLLQRKEDTTMQDLDDSGQPTLVEEANTVTGVTKAENEFQETMNKCYQGLMMHSFHDNFGQCKVGRSAISFEVKEDLVSGREHMAVHTKQNEAIKAERECLRTPCIDNSEEDLASLEKENVKESKLDPHDLVSDCEDMGLQDYASAEENLVSSDTDHEIDEKYPNLPTQYQLDEVEATTMQNMVAPEVIVITEDVLALCFKKLNVEPLVEESDESEDISLQIEVTPETKVTPEETTVPFFDYSNECPVVEETYESEAMPLQNKVTHEVTSGAGTRVFFNNSNEDAIVEESEVMLDVPMLKIMTPELKITPEDGLAPSFNYTKEDPRIEDTGVEDMTEQNMVIPEANLISKDDVAPSFDNSNEDLMVEEIEAYTTGKSGVKALEQGHEKVVGAATLYIHEHTTLDKEEVESFSRVESASGVNYASSHSEGSDGKLISTNCMTTSVADAVMESRSMPWTCDNEKQEVDAENFLDLKLRTQDREELHDVLRVEAEILQQGHETMNVEGLENDHVSIDAERQEDAVKFESVPLYPEHVNHENEKQDVDAAKFGDHKPRKQDGEELNDVSRVEAEIIDQGHETLSVEGLENDQVSIDAAKKEDAIDLESIPLYPEHVNHELEAGIQFCEPLPDTSKNEETGEFEQQGENLIQHVKRQERKKWEIPREIFELPELKTGITEIQDIKEQDSFEVERQMDKHDRKKWEIPRETFELPVLGDDVVDVEQDWEKFTQSAEKPERKKWKIQKEVLEIPILCAETVQETLEQDGFVVKTAEEEISTRDNLSTNLMFSEETFQCDGAQNEISAIEEVVVPDKGVSSGLCDDNLPEHMAKEWIPEIKMLDEEEQETPLNETSNQKETQVEMGKAVGEGECGKGLEDINMKDEIKRTLGMLWKKIYQSKQDENFESVELEEKVDDTIKGRLGSGIEHDLNLKGPVELVESPRQKDDDEAFKFSGQSSGNEENRKETSYLKQVQLNGSKTCNSREFISTTGITEEVEGNSSSAFDSCKHQEDENNNWAEETCKWNYIANDVESHSEEIRSSFGSEDSTEMAQTHGADESQKGAPETNIPPSDVNKCGLFHSEMVCELEPLPRVDSLVGDAENTQKVKKVFQENVSKEDEMAETTSASEAHQDTDDENYSEDEVEALLADEFSDISCGNSEQQETSSSRQDSKSGSDSEVADDSLSQEFDRKEDKNEIGHDMVEQSSSWKWVFGEELRDKSNKQDEAPDARQLHKEKAKIKKAADEINTSQVTGKAKINDDKPSSMEEGEQEGLQKEVTPEEEAIRNIMRAKERERIAVERAIHEAHERAFIEARERAAMEKANTEARQKETANGQERSQKTSSEAKLASEKNSLEAKQKAELERAAVERATIEARQRALEKAMSRKREQVSQSSSSRSTGDSNHQYGSSTEDRRDDDKLSESVLRLKARNDRHQRIAERAAKALAEKNMRDLLVQREQAERNRLAEILDGDVKRWANGKTSNLRALLSTLQYILGPDSGWQPIHLTDIVTTDAVKKAYRKATLFVHPDKLQQRGATIKQTYICEKVFDLLKEAWNRFDRDER